MAAKRSRLVRSSSSGDTSVFSGPFYGSESWWLVSHPSHNSSPETLPPNLPQNQSPVVFQTSSENIRPVIVRKLSQKSNRPSIFAISPSDHDPVDRKWDELVQYGSFLEKCFYCKKEMSEDEEIFMYSNLRAFCSIECRKKQIDMDEDLKKLTAKPKMRSGKRRS